MWGLHIMDLGTAARTPTIPGSSASACVALVTTLLALVMLPMTIARRGGAPMIRPRRLAAGGRPILNGSIWPESRCSLLSGALVAAEKKLTLVTFIFFAVITGIGGGTARDLLIGAPVFWVHENATLLICLGAALAVWLLPARSWKGTALLWCDAVGMAAFAAYGAAKGLPSASRRCRRSAWAFSPPASAESSATCSPASPRS